MKPSNPRILTVNGGSSSIKFALFETGDSLRRILTGGIDRIGQPEATLRVNGPTQTDNISRLVKATDHAAAVGALMDWIEERSDVMHWQRLDIASCMADRSISSRSESLPKWLMSYTV